jgi:hypothetical protein
MKDFELNDIIHFLIFSALYLVYHEHNFISEDV